MWGWGGGVMRKRRFGTQVVSEGRGVGGSAGAALQTASVPSFCKAPASSAHAGPRNVMYTYVEWVPQTWVPPPPAHPPGCGPPHPALCHLPLLTARHRGRGDERGPQEPQPQAVCPIRRGECCTVPACGVGQLSLRFPPQRTAYVQCMWVGVSGVSGVGWRSRQKRSAAPHLAADCYA